MSRFQAHSGGNDLRNSRNTEKKNHTATACWWEPDESRDSQAQQLLQLQCFTITRGTDAHHSYRAICASSKADIRNPNHVHYTINIHRNGISSCSCPDFTQNNGLACKHLRMLRSLIQGWIGSHLEHEFTFPLTASLSREIQERQVSSDLGSGTAPILPPPLKSVDWSAIQALGNDTMTLNDNDSHTVNPAGPVFHLFSSGNPYFII
jgi:SWIM zinc finger